MSRFRAELNGQGELPAHWNTEELAARIRRDVVQMTHDGNSSHVGSCLSMADAAAVLYGHVLRVDPDNPEWEDRDRFVLSKGHAGACVYAALAESGFFPLSKLKTHYQDGSDLSGHVSHKGIPGVEVSTGSLGHGLGIGTGLAYGAALDGHEWRTYVLMSDGECDEGSVWEAALFAAHHGLGNLTAIVDYNKIQSLARVDDTIRLEPFADKWSSFGWDVVEVDGHDHTDLKRGLCWDGRSPDRPRVVIAHTVKGKGVSFMEDTVLWHYRSPQGDEFDAAMEELG